MAESVPGARSQTDVVIESIKGMLTRGELKPGSRLPIERDLASLLGVSRGSLREGVRALCAEFPAEYWRKIDEEKGFPEAFVTAMTEAGWQRGDLPFRECVRYNQAGERLDPPQVLPAVEVRVVDPHGRVKLVGF